MDDKDSKPPRGRKPGEKRFSGAGKGGRPPAGAGKPKSGRPRPASAKAGDGDFKRERKPYRPREESGGAGERPRRPFHGPDAAAGDAERKPFRKPYKPREDRSGERPQRAFQKRDAAGGGAERKPFRKPYREHGAGEDRRPRSGHAPGGAGRKERPPASAGFKPRPLREEAPQESGERIARRLARAGIASRRDAEELIAAGRVKVNGKVLSSPAFNVAPGDVIHLDGMEIPPVERTRLFLFHKPAGVVTTNRDPEGRRTVFDVLPADLPRLMTVGRLDINTEGLLLLTNDGGLSRVLELPATGWLRRYRVRVHGKVDETALAGLREGIAVDGVFYGAVEAALERTQGSNAWLTIGLREGKNREVKNILGALGLDVARLIRISYGPFQLGELPEGHVLEIKGRTLRDQLGERLIEESGANFDADVLKPFSNKPVRRTEPKPDAPPRARPLRDGSRPPIGEGGLIKARKRRENSRDEALGKLSTRPDRFGDGPQRGPAGRKPGGEKRFGEKRFDEKKFGDRPADPPGRRNANVWMAPGARPKKAETSEAPSPRSREEGKGAGRHPRHKDRAPSSSFRERGEGKGRPRTGPKKR